MEKRGRFQAYDKQQVLQDIADGFLSAKAIARKHGITQDMVYSFKYQAKKKNLLRDPALKMDDLDAVETKRIKDGPYAHRIYLIAEDYATGKMSGQTFYKELCGILKENP